MKKEDAAQSCADVHGEGWGLAKFTAQEFSCQQSAVAEAVTASVGPDQPVMTGVQVTCNLRHMFRSEARKRALQSRSTGFAKERDESKSQRQGELVIEKM
jgi:hypothetical protein